MARLQVILFSLVLLSLCGLFSSQVTPTPCLYSQPTNTVLKPLILPASACPNNKTKCMNIVWAYGNFQYNGKAALKPNQGEIALYLAQYPDATNSIHLISILNANVSTNMNVTFVMTGTNPAPIELYDDPSTPTGDQYYWNNATSSGLVRWVTLPTYTDGFIVGPLTFTDNYCISATLSQPNNAISTMSVFSGNYSNPYRALTGPYIPGTTIQFCQYPQTLILKRDVSCPGGSDGSANISVVLGPTTVIYRWFNSAGVLIGTTASISGLTAGNYTAAVNDSTNNGCNAIRSVVITQPTMLSATVTTTPFTCTTYSTATATPNGGVGGFTYQWLNGTTVIGTGSSISNLFVGSYAAQITDTCGAVSTYNFTITTPGCCGDGICQANEVCGSASFCAADCAACCAPGTYIANTTCIPCAAGTTSNVYGATSCPPCAANTFNAGGSDVCAPCPNNTVSAAGSGVCTACPSGQIRASTDSVCHTCGAGSIPTCGSSTCTQCAPGTISADGVTACQACPPGTYTATAGSAACFTCPAGTYSAAGAAACTSCPTGLSSPAGSTHLLFCQ